MSRYDDVSVAAAHVLHVMVEDPAGMKPGTFIRCLIQTFAVADRHNQWLLSEVYPAYGRVFEILDGRRTEGDPAAGLEMLRQLAAAPRR